MLIHQLMQEPEYSLLREEARTAHCIEIDNVAEWFFLSSQDVWDPVRDIPNLAPPFPVVWMEYGRPAHFVSKAGEASHQQLNVGFPRRIGCLARAFDSADGWTYMFILFLQPNEGKDIKVVLTYKVGHDGSVIPQDNTRVPMLVVPPTDRVNLDQQKCADATACVFRWPFLLAITFMHCKNASLERAPKLDTPKPQLKQGVPHTRFSRIIVAPFRADARKASGEEGVSVQKALHICRGHFKDYRKSGLFGKIPGIFWWDQHARGNADCGIVKSTHVIEVN